VEAGQAVHLCEPEQGTMLGEDDEDGKDEIQNEDLMKCLESSV
jgi:hypothetical protein